MQNRSSLWLSVPAAVSHTLQYTEDKQHLVLNHGAKYWWSVVLHRNLLIVLLFRVTECRPTVLLEGCTVANYIYLLTYIPTNNDLDSEHDVNCQCWMGLTRSGSKYIHTLRYILTYLLTFFHPCWPTYSHVRNSLTKATFLFKLKNLFHSAYSFFMFYLTAMYTSEVHTV